MNCKNCGNLLNQGELFCPNCGTKVENESNSIAENRQINNSTNINVLNNNINEVQNNQQIQSNINNSANQIQNEISNSNSINENKENLGQVNNVTYQQTQYYSTPEPVKPKKNSLIKILAIIGGIIIGSIILFIAIFFIVSANSAKLICKSNEGNITIMYNKKAITGYQANGISYDFDGQKEYALQIGTDNYIKEFSNWFKNNTSGTCTVNGKEVLENNNVVNDDFDNEINNLNIVGDKEHGYITIPNNWVEFYDTVESTSIQYSYSNLYIVTLDYIENPQYTAEEYASNYMHSKLNSSDVTEVTGATIQIGKNKQYTAYQVYMYYPSDGTYLITYWFEAEDGYVHYAALEGPNELNGIYLADYLYIPESFSLSR